jgi:hypothetical protein
MAKIAEHPDPQSPEGKKRRKDCDAAYAGMISAVDKLVALGFRKKAIFHLISVHILSRPRKAKSLTVKHRAG